VGVTKQQTFAARLLAALMSSSRLCYDGVVKSDFVLR
jgi:hypothetical protein